MRLTWPEVRARLVGRDLAHQAPARGVIRRRARAPRDRHADRTRFRRLPSQRLQGPPRSPSSLSRRTAPRAPLATGGDDHALKFWSIDSGELYKSVQIDSKLTGDGVNSLAFSPKGDQVVAATGGGAQLWSVESGQLARRLDPWEAGALGAAWSPRGDLIATTRRGDERVRVFSASDGWLAHTLVGHHGDVYALAFAPTGDRLATASADETVRLWSLSSEKPVRVYVHSGAVLALAFSPVGDLLAATADDHSLRIWSALDGRSILDRIRTSGSVRALAFSPSGDRLYYGGDDQVVRAIDPRSGAVLWSRTIDSKPLALALSSDGEKLALSLGSGQVQVWWTGR